MGNRKMPFSGPLQKTRPLLGPIERKALIKVHAEEGQGKRKYMPCSAFSMCVWQLNSYIRFL
jgi:hypothetical protein